MRLKNPQLDNLFKTTQNKTYSIVGITILTVGVFIFLAIRPSYSKIMELREEIEKKEALLQKLVKKRENIQYLVAQKDSISEQLIYFDEAMPQKAEEGYMIANLAAIADREGMTLRSISFNREVEREYENETAEHDIQIMQVSLSLNGDYEQIETFVDHLSKFPRIFDIRSVSYSRDETEDEEGNNNADNDLRVGISFFAFYLEEEEEVNL